LVTSCYHRTAPLSTKNSNTASVLGNKALLYEYAVPNSITTFTLEEREALNQNIRRLANKLHISLAQLAREAGLSSVKEILRRGSGRMGSLRAIAIALGTTVDGLLTPTETDERPLPRELNQMYEDMRAVIGDIADEEAIFLRNLNPPSGREMTVKAYYLALEMFRATKRHG
jgi:transcriptional regulator with XRE-family HTH domain